MSIFKKALFLSPLFLLISCGSKTIYVTEVLPTSTTEFDVAATSPEAYPDAYDNYSTTRQDFLSAVRELNPIASAYISDQELIDVALTVCDSLRSGMSSNDVYAAISDASSGDRSAAEFYSSVIAASITFYCPDQLYKFETT